jgi:uncharacterized membrane protein YphA (DoxX/SURF4 family)
MNKVISKDRPASKFDAMNIVLWMLQILLAAAFLAHGVFFLSPPAEMVAMLNSSTPLALRLFIGVAEVLAAIGLTLPGITRILPRLVAWAAAGLVILMASATVFHAARGEISSAVTTAVLLVVIAFVAYMRWKVKPIAAR